MARAILKGISISPGIAIGPLHLAADSNSIEKRSIEPERVEAEIASLMRASEKVCENLAATMENIPSTLADCREIIAAQIELASDQRLLEGARARITHRRICASWALADTISELCAIFQSLPEPYLRDRAQDIKIIGKCLQNSLAGIQQPEGINQGEILAGYELSPADMLNLQPDGLKGLITVEGGSTSHTAILARGIKAPALIGVTELFRIGRPGEMVILDGLAGLVLFGPDEQDLNHYSYRQKNYASFEEEAEGTAHLPAVSRDGMRIAVNANIDKPDEMADYHSSGAEGIGLYRTEYSYFGKDLPDEEQLTAEYSHMLASVFPHAMIFRTLDAGSDKALPVNEAIHEPNPALGLRGIRFSLHHPDIFKAQLRAILRANANKIANILLPMVTTTQELAQTRQLIKATLKELQRHKIACAEDFSLGVMLETPAAVLICEELASQCDFISIGTNDLIHYLMAIDRSNRHVAYLHEPLHPAFIRSLKMIVDAAHKKGTPVSVCGELASDPFGAAILIGLGVDSLSAAPRFVPMLKFMIRNLNSGACANLAKEALEGMEADALRQLANRTLQEAMGSRLQYLNTLSSAKTLQ